MNEPKNESWMFEKLDERQRLTIGYSRIYTQDFSAAGDVGHNQRLLIALLADYVTELHEELAEVKWKMEQNNK